MKLNDAIQIMDEFKDNKYLSTTGNTCKELIHFSEDPDEDTA